MCIRDRYYVNLEANTFDTFKVEPSLMTVFEQSHTWDELVRHFVDSYVVETDKKAVASFYDLSLIHIYPASCGYSPEASSHNVHPLRVPRHLP